MLQSVNQQNAAVLPIMLSTKLLPEMEEREAAMLQEHKEKVGSMKENDQYEMLLVSLAAACCIPIGAHRGIISQTCCRSDLCVSG